MGIDNLSQDNPRTYDIYLQHTRAVVKDGLRFRYEPISFLQEHCCYSYILFYVELFFIDSSIMWFKRSVQKDSYNLYV